MSESEIVGVFATKEKAIEEIFSYAPGVVYNEGDDTWDNEPESALYEIEEHTMK